ncbi:MAG: PilC/PilY family type IV pilus protein, partial [Telluria sp.]
GAELFAYVPAALMAHLAALSSPTYQARPYVDGSPGQGDARVGGGWRTVLASGMGMGARGVFALDITDPTQFGQGLGALWEFTADDDPAMGHVREAPVIAKINTNKGGKLEASRHFAIVSSGWNSLAPHGDGTLFLLALDKPAAQTWQRGANYFSMSTTGANGDLPNALSAPALVLAADGSARRAYAGDLHGRLWRFDFQSMTAHRLFTARDQEGVAQPIAHAPKVVFAPGGGYVVVFATGKLIEETDLLPAAFTQQSVYAILDGPGTTPDPVSARSQLAERTLATAATGYAITGGRFAYAGPGAKKGWYFDFPNALTQGERAAASPVSIEGAIALASILPGAANDGAPSSRLYIVDALTGFAYDPVAGAMPDAATGELAPIAPSLPPLFVVSGLAVGARNPTGGATATRRVTLVTPYVTGQVPPAITIDVQFPSGRLGWREVGNWHELHWAATGKRR